MKIISLFIAALLVTLGNGESSAVFVTVRFPGAVEDKVYSQPGKSAFEVASAYCRTKDIDGAYSNRGQDPITDETCVVPLTLGLRAEESKVCEASSKPAVEIPVGIERDGRKTEVLFRVCWDHNVDDAAILFCDRNDPPVKQECVDALVAEARRLLEGRAAEEGGEAEGSPDRGRILVEPGPPRSTDTPKVAATLEPVPEAATTAEAKVDKEVSPAKSFPIFSFIILLFSSAALLFVACFAGEVEKPSLKKSHKHKKGKHRKKAAPKKKDPNSSLVTVPVDSDSESSVDNGSEEGAADGPAAAQVSSGEGAVAITLAAGTSKSVANPEPETVLAQEEHLYAGAEETKEFGEAETANEANKERSSNNSSDQPGGDSAWGAEVIGDVLSSTDDAGWGGTVEEANPEVSESRWGMEARDEMVQEEKIAEVGETGTGEAEVGAAPVSALYQMEGRAEAAEYAAKEAESLVQDLQSQVQSLEEMLDQAEEAAELAAEESAKTMDEWKERALKAEAALNGSQKKPPKAH